MVTPQLGDQVVVHMVPRHLGMLVAKMEKTGESLRDPRKVAKVLRPGVFELAGLPGIGWAAANLRVVKTLGQQDRDT